jgi:aryl-alcohol dehydrogenase-like predicted oxidoreductase
MEYRSFGNTDLKVSAVGFGAWGIGGASMAAETPIGWGSTDDETSIAALRRANDRGINFYDTADFYGLGRSETLIGEVFGNRSDVVIATKVGHRLTEKGEIFMDYSGAYIREACEKSLVRLQRDAIDYYQLHTAKIKDLKDGDCIEAMETLGREGKIRYWGVSLNTFHPVPEAEYMLTHELGHGFQLVLNILNQRAAPLLRKMAAAGYGVIARMPLQFGLLTGKFDAATRFEKNDHRSFRLTPEVLRQTLSALQPAWELCEKYGITKAGLALSFALSFPEVSTVIPGIKTPRQADLNTSDIVDLDPADKGALQQLFEKQFRAELMPVLERAG